MRTTYIVMLPNGETVTGVEDLPSAPTFMALQKLCGPHLDPKGGTIERVAVLHDDERKDMFVGEQSALVGLPRNERATRIYRNNWLTQHPNDDPETLPAIYGGAVLFGRRVWF